MMDWFRMYAEFSSDPKVQMMSETFQRRLIMLFCIRSGNECETFQDKDVVFQLRISEEEWAETKAVFLDKKFIEICDMKRYETQMKQNVTFKIANWNKRQYLSDSSTARVRRHREKKKQAGNVSETPPDTDTDTEKKERTPRKPPEGAAQIPDWMPPEVWKNFMDHRGKKFTPNAQRIAIGQLERWRQAGHDPTEIINKSIMNGWKGLFEPDGKNSTGGKKNATNRPNLTHAERLKAAGDKAVDAIMADWESRHGTGESLAIASPGHAEL